MRQVLALFAAVLLAGCSRNSPDAARPVAPGAEAVSLLGDTLRSPDLPPETRAIYETRLDSARRAVAAHPDDPDALIWLGRRTAYLGRYREAVAIFTRGIAQWPRDARFYRHRGHRYITLRDFERATRDLERAATLVRGTLDVVEPDGLPNARNIPTGTIQFNIYYHLGLAHFLRADYRRALDAWERCLGVSLNHDAQVATRYWLYLTLRRLGRTAAARETIAGVATDLDIIENRSYHRLLLVFKGDLSADSLMGDGDGVDGATAAYGLSAWHEAEGRAAQADSMRRRARAGNQWAAFGFIAAEADLARSQR